MQSSAAASRVRRPTHHKTSMYHISRRSRCRAPQLHRAYDGLRLREQARIIFSRRSRSELAVPSR
eukprot:12197981-Alexandrium_andersonii.AAC.1